MKRPWKVHVFTRPVAGVAGGAYRATVCVHLPDGREMRAHGTATVAGCARAMAGGAEQVGLSFKGLIKAAKKAAKKVAKLKALKMAVKAMRSPIFRSLVSAIPGVGPAFATTMSVVDMTEKGMKAVAAAKAGNRDAQAALSRAQDAAQTNPAVRTALRAAQKLSCG